jgi:hypothetical protein
MRSFFKRGLLRLSVGEAGGAGGVVLPPRRGSFSPRDGIKKARDSVDVWARRVEAAV